jgi:hypothetical protein
MQCIVIFGPAAVGKMSVGMALAELTGFKLFHNHIAIELVHQFFTWSDPEFTPLVQNIRGQLFTALKDSKVAGVIFTYVWALELPEDHDELLRYIDQLGIEMESVLFVELCADQSVRLARNKTELRLQEKKTKRNLAESEYFLLQSEQNHRLNSNGDFFYPEQHLKIDNTELSPTAVAKMIQSALLQRAAVPAQ